MNCEIERKFLILPGDASYKAEAIARHSIKQGYICRHPSRTVRVRVCDDDAFLTIKGAADASGTTRFEWEKPVSLDDARALMALCEPGIIEKTRYIVPFGRHTFEVDEFYGAHAGLVLAEIELDSPEELFERPPWLGDEVTGNANYYNAQLSNTATRD